jgi:hypothetical protein
MAVVSRKPKSAVQETSTETPVADQTEPTAQKTMKLELRFLGRYFFQNTLYEKGRVYEFSEDDAREMLTHTVDNLPVFTFAKPRVKYVEVPADDAVVRIQRVRESRKTMTLEQFALEKQGKVVKDIAPIDLSDDDPEIAQKLANADSDGDDGQEI